MGKYWRGVAKIGMILNIALGQNISLYQHEFSCVSMALVLSMQSKYRWLFTSCKNVKAVIAKNYTLAMVRPCMADHPYTVENLIQITKPSKL